MNASEQEREIAAQRIATRQKLQCDLSNFYREVLGWDYNDIQKIREHEIVTREYKFPTPPDPGDLAAGVCRTSSRRSQNTRR